MVTHLFGYSPFSDQLGNHKTIYEIEYSDLEQLREKDVQEGIQLDYKRELSKSVKSKLPILISSFANERGGWLFIGINDDKSLNPLERDEYELTINNLLKDTTDPIPTIVVRFLTPQEDSAHGVVVVWVPEGERPPYITKGQIYRRVGSGTHPYREIQNRFELDRLYTKGADFNQKRADFCRKEISVYSERWSSLLYKYIPMGICNVYLLPEFDLQIDSLMKPDQLLDFLIKGCRKSQTYTIGDSGSITMHADFERGQYSVDSVILRNSPYIDDHEHVLAWEQMYDGSAKIHLPLLYVKDREPVIERIKNLSPNYRGTDIFKHVEFIEGATVFNALVTTFGQYFRLMRELQPRFKRLAVVVDVEAITKNTLYFDTETYYKLVSDNGVFFADKGYSRLNRNFKLFSPDDSLVSMLFPFSNMFYAFGLNISDGMKMYMEASEKEWLRS